MLKILLIVGAGGFFGSIARYLTSLFFNRFFETSFPISTFTVNILGSFLIGIIYAFSDKSNFLSPELRMFLAVGFCGGFTTFSSFAFESLSQINNQMFFQMAIYISLSIFFGLLATYLGVLLVKLYV